jgi:hypothetical protein
VSVAFHDNQNANPAPLTRTFTVPAGKIRDVVDVLDSLLGLPVGSAGALRFTSDASVAILCRTSNVDPAGVKPGTFGAQQKPTSLLSFLMSADAGAVVTGIRQNGTFRTNIGFAAGEDGAAYSMTLKSTSGATVATTTGSLGPFGWTQPNIADVFPGTTVPEDATLLVPVTSGSVDVFDSSIDNASGDPVVTPIMMLSAEIPSSATIGPAGGSIRSNDGALTLRIPAGALSAPVAIALALAPNDAPGGVGPGYDLSPDGLAFAKPALLSLRYGPGGLDVPEIDGLALAFPSGTSWAGLTGGRIDASARTLTIGLPNTSPPPPSSVRPGRATHGIPGASRNVFLKGLRIVEGRTWIPTDGTTNLYPVFVLPPSCTGSKFTSFLISQVNLDPRNVTFFTPAIGTIDRKNADTFTYTAPHSLGHASLPVKVLVKAAVTHGAGIPFGSYEKSTTLWVVRRRWVLNVEFKLNLPCVAGSGNEDFTYAYSDDQTQGIRLGDDLSIGKLPFLGGLPSAAVLTSCKCASTMLEQPGTVTFDSVGGSFVAGPPPRFQMVGNAAISHMIPSIQETCPDGIGGTYTFTDDPVSFGFDLFLGLQSKGGLRPHDGKDTFTIFEPPILTIVVDWYSYVE